MKKHKVIYIEKTISDNEINHFMDFQKTLKQSRKVLSINKTVQYIKYISAISTALVAVVTISYFHQKSSKTNNAVVTNSTTLETGIETSSTLYNPTDSLPATSNEKTIASGNETADSLEVTSNPTFDQKDQNENIRLIQTEKTSEKVSQKIEEANSENTVESKPSAAIELKREKNISTTLKNKDAILSKIAKTSAAEPEQFVEAYPLKGYPHLYQYFSEKLNYPEKAKQERTSGTVLVEFEVLENSTITNIKIVKGKSPELEKEAIRLISSMPEWKPAYINGRPVPTKLTLPLTFQLEHSK